MLYYAILLVYLLIGLTLSLPLVAELKGPAEPWYFKILVLIFTSVLWGPAFICFFVMDILDL